MSGFLVIILILNVRLCVHTQDVTKQDYSLSTMCGSIFAGLVISLKKLDETPAPVVLVLISLLAGKAVMTVFLVLFFSISMLVP